MNASVASQKTKKKIAQEGIRKKYGIKMGNIFVNETTLIKHKYKSSLYIAIGLVNYPELYSLC